MQNDMDSLLARCVNPNEARLDSKMKWYLHEISLWLCVAVIVQTAFALSTSLGSMAVLTFTIWIGHVACRGEVEDENKL